VGWRQLELLDFQRQPFGTPAGNIVWKCRNSAISSAVALPALPESVSDDHFEIRPGSLRDRGNRAAKPKSLVAQIRALSNKAGRVDITGRGGAAPDVMPAVAARLCRFGRARASAGCW